MANRPGRPKTKIDKQEMVGAFARMTTEDRAWVISVLSGIHEALAPEEPEQEEVKP